MSIRVTLILLLFFDVSAALGQSGGAQRKPKRVNETVIVTDPIGEFNRKITNAISLYSSISEHDEVFDRAKDLAEQLAQDPENEELKEEFAPAQMAAFELYHGRQIEFLKAFKEVRSAFAVLKGDLTTRINATTGEEQHFAGNAAEFRNQKLELGTKLRGIRDRLPQGLTNDILTDEVTQLIYYQESLRKSMQAREADSLRAQGSIVQQRDELQHALQLASRVEGVIRGRFADVEMQAAELEVAAEAAAVIHRSSRDQKLAGPIEEVAGAFGDDGNAGIQNVLDELRSKLGDRSGRDASVLDPEYRSGARQILENLDDEQED